MKERIDVLRKASMHDAKFLANGGTHLTTDVFFLHSRRMRERENEVDGQCSFGSEEILQKRVNKINLGEFSKLEKIELETL
jgi:hypothetical protein